MDEVDSSTSRLNVAQGFFIVSRLHSITILIYEQNIRELAPEVSYVNIQDVVAPTPPYFNPSKRPRPPSRVPYISILFFSHTSVQASFDLYHWDRISPTTWFYAIMGCVKKV